MQEKLENVKYLPGFVVCTKQEKNSDSGKTTPKEMPTQESAIWEKNGWYPDSYVGPNICKYVDVACMYLFARLMHLHVSLKGGVCALNWRITPNAEGIK